VHLDETDGEDWVRVSALNADEVGAEAVTR
jgi:hypothetical protein